MIGLVSGAVMGVLALALSKLVTRVPLWPRKRAKKLTPLERTNFVDNEVKRPQYLESEMLQTQNVGMHL